jgi:hypothetical protein
MVDTLASSIKYRQRAEENGKLAHALVNQSPIWATVIAFYSAVHYVNQYACLKGCQLRSHPERGNYIADTPALRPISRQYNRLQEYSEACRYSPEPDLKYHDPTWACREVFSRLGDIVACIDKAMADPKKQSSN